MSTEYRLLTLHIICVLCELFQVSHLHMYIGDSGLTTQEPVKLAVSHDVLSGMCTFSTFITCALFCQYGFQGGQLVADNKPMSTMSSTPSSGQFVVGM